MQLPPETKGKKTSQKIVDCFTQAFNPAFKTIVWLLKLIIPISFGVMLLDYSGALNSMANWLAPFMKVFGLRGEAALAILSGVFLNIYSSVAVMETVEFTMREITIIALINLVAHSLIMEGAIQKKTGSNPIWMTTLRILAAMAGALLLNWLLPESSELYRKASVSIVSAGFSEIFYQWIIQTIYLCLKIILVIYFLNVLQRLLDVFSITLMLSKIMSPVLRLFGLPEQATFLWIIANVIGLSWGSGVLIEETRKGKITREEADILNHHIAISHSLLEDTLIFVAIGVSAVWITFPRFFLAFLAVWIYRIFFLRRKVLASS